MSTTRVLRSRSAAHAIVLTCSFLLGACDRGGAGVGPSPESRVASVQVDPQSLSLVAGTQQQLSAQPRDGNQKPIADMKVEWTSSDQTRATVDPSGMVSAVSPGEVVITAAVGEKQGIARLVVTAPKSDGPTVGSISLTPPWPTSLLVGGTLQVRADVYATGPAGPKPPITGRPPAWTSSDSSVASVIADSTGFRVIITARKPGSATVSASLDGVSSSIPVTVIGPAASVTLSRASATLSVGDTALFRVTLRDAAGTEYPDLLYREAVVWSTSDPGKANINTPVGPSNALVKAVAAGSVTLTATAVGAAGGLSASAQLTIRPAVASVEVSPGSVTLAPGASQAFTATARDAGGAEIAGLPVEWNVSDLAVLSTSAQGAVTARAPGAARVIATVKGISGSAAVTVPGTSPATSIRWLALEAGVSHTCGIAQGGKAYCWGLNSSGQLGDGTRTSSDKPRAVSGNLTFIHISAGNARTCGVTAQGSTFCWGDMYEAPSNVPLQVNAPAFTSVHTGYSQACALAADGTPHCWGAGSRFSSKNPVIPPVGEAKFTAVSAGNDASCGLAANGGVTCWVGVGFASYVVRSASSIRQIDVSTTTRGYGFVCGVAAEGGVSCSTQVGFGPGGQRFLGGLTDLAGGPAIRQISAGGERVCGLDAAGGTYCWPRVPVFASYDHTFGAAVREAAGFSFAKLSVGDRHTCAVTADGRGYCWGENGSGELGIALTGGRSAGPSPVVDP